MSKTMKENDHKLGSAEFESTFIQTGPHWKGFEQVKHFIVFGASYCDVGYSHREAHPTPERPLGVDFPGDTYNEPGKPNWVGHLVTMEHNFLVHDYGKGGAMVDGVRYQVETEFLPHAGTWVGINDCAYIHEPAKVKRSIDELFLTQQKLYEAGARNYVFVNVPPIDRSPAGKSDSQGASLFH
ncbi:hypothetical protein EWM64_g297 [Hericium alpestre]|uniref:SGNH hydrolase-type esterase domain-containing protein n=1 Tax=Hericium alpestre TaxID=135208 RepID=A0A4Z0ABQ4_9AGAM|nr:hypothetical protein EWM64_g297 [Hericium alpestre]